MFDDINIDTSFKAASRSVRAQTQDVYARLRSIDSDARFVRSVQAANNELPLVANLRCGAWYVPPELAHPDTPAYFKSTDGHQGQWDFSLRRSNLHLLPLIEECGGIILVDSTRRGKRLPDALSKTIPAWCATINRALVLRDGIPRQCDSSATTTENEAEESGWSPRIFVPSRTVSDSERTKMEARLDGWARKLLDSSLTLPSLKLPLRPIFLTNDPSLPPPPTFPPASTLSFHPVFCVSASEYSDGRAETATARQGGFEYHPGAGDDHELWGRGLTSEDWWEWREEILNIPRERLQEEIARRIEEKKRKATREEGTATATVDSSSASSAGLTASNVGQATVIPPTSLLYLATLPFSDPTKATLSIRASSSSQPAPSPSPQPTSSSSSSPSPLTLELTYKPSKEGISPLFPTALAFLEPHLRAGRSCVIACETGKDASVGLALCALQRLFADDGSLLPPPSSTPSPDGRPKATKATLQARLHWILNVRQGVANPSRATLKKTNEFCLSGRFRPGGGAGGA